MVTMTEKAAGKLKELAAKQKEGLMLRVSVGGFG